MKTIISLSIIIPTLNNVKGLKNLLTYFKDKPYKVVVIDNKPTNEKKQLIEFFGSRVNELTSLNYLSQKRNLGFAGSINLGAKFVKTKWLLILNDDIEFENDQLINQLYTYAENKKFDALSPILVNLNGEVENLGYKILSYGKVNLVKELTGSRVNELDGLTAACLLVKTSVFKRLKGFDESFFAYLEDVDFFLRFKKAGYRMAIYEDIKVFHNHMTTSKTMGNFKARQDMINWWRLYFKHRDRFKFDIAFVVERLRNFSGYVRATIRINK